MPAISRAVNHAGDIACAAKDQWILLNRLIFAQLLGGSQIIVVIRKSFFEGPIYEEVMSHLQVIFVESGIAGGR